MRIVASIPEFVGSRQRVNAAQPAEHELNRGLPKAFGDCERAIIDERRALICRKWRTELIGLALSGGGVRSATFNLGVLQAFATHGVLRSIDYLSTVSGGGYTGSFLGRFYTRFVNRPEGAVDVIEARLRDVNSPEISWLRRSSEYVAAVGVGEEPMTTAAILRAFLTVHAFIGVLLVAIFGFVNMVRYALFPWFVEWVDPMLADVTRLSLPVHLRFPDPWLVLLAIVIAIAVMPLAIAFWLPSDSRPESYHPTRLIAVFVSMVAGFVFAFRYGAWLLAASIFASALCVFIWMEVAWIRVGRRVPGATTHPSGRLMVRNQLSKWLGVSISAAVVVCGIWMLDEMVLRLYNWCVSASHVAYVFALSLVLLLLPLRRLAQWVFVGSSVGRGGERGSWWRILTSPFVLPVALGVPLLMGWNFISHAMFQGGADVWAGMLWTAVAAVVIAMLGAYSGIDLVNRSSAHSLYATRGSRAYLGASNPFRHVTEVGADVTSPQLEDDISFERYRPDRAGGPVHIINVFANQSLDRSSGRRTRDQQGHNMAVGPVGISVGPVSHAMWVPRKGLGEPEAELTTVGECDLPDPFVPRQHSPNKNMCAVLQTKALRLSEWMALSGAAVTAGPYAETRLGTSLLYGLTNVRSGFWWDSGIEDGERQGQPFPSMPRKLVRLLWRRFRAPRLLVAELTGRFPGPWRRYWYLSDGGQADDLGVYELVRRRVPVIICSDATRDVDGGLAALANAMRRVRVDFGATIEFLSKSALDGLASTAMGQRPPQSALDAIGTLDDLRREPNANSRKHAALARVRYEGANAHSILLYIKATITGDEPVDVLEYRRQHHRFPHQSVLNQFLDEAQWESYRELGLHCASPLFGSGVDWLADVLNALQGDRDASQPRV